MLRRLLGLIIMVVSVILIALLLLTAVRMGPAVDNIVLSLDDLLSVTEDTLQNTSLTLEQTRATVVEANSALENAASATSNLALTMRDMEPVLESSTQVVTQDVPDNIEAIQDAIPNITQVAGVIDDVLTRLSAFRIDQTIPIPFNPINLNFDLGIDYEPDQPFDESIQELGTSLEGMPEELRSLETDLDNLAADLDLLTANIDTAATDIEKINGEVALFIPIIDEYLDLVGEFQQSLSVVREQVASQLEALANFLIFIFVLLALTQIAPLYLGWELITGQRASEAGKEPVQETPPPVVVQVSPGDESEVEQQEEAPVAKGQTPDVQVNAYGGEEGQRVEVIEEPVSADAETLVETSPKHRDDIDEPNREPDREVDESGA